ncbi:LCP family protein [Tengunoibacter tsumagoiensis]|uniref:Cell envelope-related transcriptional attenuator domain-containing protein n=1 Tax=Tengunoibacter tsumagoiensis TaxID=2014871 RepID=A0A402A0C7_9CHLR|nr:LCP family protein [Tengunoibacter tsumagoiensis]GCE12600.1 hypothetical protein KTT_24590 [Tengunoibacter tsumagoiensis]
MPNSRFSEDEPTQPDSSHSHGQPHRKQEKLILGGFQDAPKQEPRRPYQYQPDATPSSGPQPYQAPRQNRQHAQNESYQPYMPAGQNQPSYPHTPAAPPQRGHQSTHRPPTEAPTVYPQRPNQNPSQGQIGNKPSSSRTARPRKKRNAGKIGCLATLAIVVVLVIVAFNLLQHVLAFGSAISTQSPLSSQTGYMGGSERTNLLVLGYGGGSHEGGTLTDSILNVSVLPQSHHTSLVSIPRDLWVQVPSNSGNYGKMNAVFAYSYNKAYDEELQKQKASGSNQDDAQKAANIAGQKAGGDAALEKINYITGMNTKYWMTIDFTGFRDLIDSIGGVDVYVPDSFTSLYPKNDDPNVDASWITVSFTKGQQHMNGERAIEYARARHSEDNPAEGTDFARSARQQIIVKATLAKVKQWSTWPSLFNAMDALQKTIYTNMSLADLAEFSTKMDLNDPHTAHIGLTNDNVLVDSYAGGGQAILTAKDGNWDAIKTYVQQNLYN